MDNNVPHWYGETAQSIAPVGIIMAGFMLVYSIWFGFSWGILGWILFGFTVLLSLFLIIKSVKHIKHSKRFIYNESEEGKKIGKAMGILSGISYGALWLFVILFLVFGLYKFIMPTVTFIIGLHFIPQARIFNRKIDYFVAPLPISSSIIAYYFAIESNNSWSSVYAIAGIGGVLSTAIYGLYMIITYKNLAIKHGIDY
ncbi:hypothetical protein [Oceanobacillus bengalensis]|uniref:Uncharacterized protein n=1 Tax=Oceanobacillus bengalensis TaxID=1435466 RepID=A0A494Z3M5_9BACI|nr:hypothetical protein [Oceanobacillus bengalensis]RKQ17117.1 hypothetical protein D8M05_05455 [Oceanobacillus bengalensis]